MRILVINIALRDNPTRKLLPIGLGYVVSAIHRAGYQFDLLDLDAKSMTPREIEHFVTTNEYDVVMMGCIVTGYRHVKWMAQTIRRAHPNTTIIVGNTVAQSIPEVLLGKTECDIAVMGEGDEVAVRLLEQLETSKDVSGIAGIAYRKGGQVIRTPKHPLIANIDSIPSPNWDLFDIETYIDSCSKAVNEPLPPIPKSEIRSMPVNTARGCPYKCTFCYHIFRGEKYRWRSAEAIVAEMKNYHERYGINHFAFNDELTFHSPKQAETFADTLLNSGLQVYFGGNCRSGLFSKTEHIAIARKLHKAGCLSLVFSLESTDPDILRWMKKGITPNMFARQVEILRAGGIAPLTSVVVGYPQETEETIRRTISFCADLGIFPSTGFLLPQPGSVMYDHARAGGWIPDEEAYLLAMGDRQDLHVNMTSMSDNQMRKVVEESLAECSRKVGVSSITGSLLKTGAYRSGDLARVEGERLAV